MTTKAKILRDIRENCLMCVGGSYKAVEECTATEKTCKLVPYRFGKDPNPSAAKKVWGQKLAKKRKEQQDALWAEVDDDEEGDG